VLCKHALQTSIFMPILMLSNLEKYYPRAYKFIPERWIKEDPKYYKAHPFLTMPFGFGQIMCTGRRFADLEIESLVTKVS
jgi:cytochrome P450